MITLGAKFVIMGDWDTSPEPEGLTVIRMPPAPPSVYGCWNKTTQMCVAELEQRLTPGMSLLDFGTGSGILAVVAAKLGASPVYATENVTKVAEFAQKVWVLNNVTVALVEGPLPKVDFCVANIGDNLWDAKHGIEADTLLNVSNKGDLVVVHGVHQ